jgi:hypothetical protein
LWHLFAIKETHCATKTWIGPNGGDWHKPANWNPSGIHKEQIASL